jgi:phage virion morphogenesis protein
MVKIEIDDRDVMSALQALMRRGGDMSPAMANIAQVLASESERQFRDQAGPGGAVWPDLTEATKAMRKKRGTWPGATLQVSAGGLAASVQTGYAPAEAWIGSNKPYAAMHQFGGITSPRSMIPGKVIEARPFLPFDPQTERLSADAERTILEVLGGYLAAE